MVTSNQSKQAAFTIVELLVVIVVIGILATITIVSYSGITQNATASSLRTDLANASTKLRLYQVDNNVFPDSMTLSGSNNYCPTPADARYCVKTSGNNVFTYTPGRLPNPQAYVLTGTNNTANVTITNNSAPIATAPSNPVADWLAVEQGDHYGNYYDLIGKTYATVTRATPKTIYDPTTQRIYDVPANYLGVNPRSDGKSGREVVIEEARTNLILNSDFETGLTNWSAALGTMSQDSSKSVHGNYSSKFTASASNGRPDYYVMVTGGQSYTFSAYVWVPSGYNSLQLEAYDSGNATAYDINITGNGAWKNYTTTFTASSGTPTIYLRIVDRAASNWQSFYVDAPQLETGVFASSYIPTTTATASRNADVVIIPTTNWSVNAGTLTAVAGSQALASQVSALHRWASTSGTFDLIASYTQNGSYGNLYSYSKANGINYAPTNIVRASGGYFTGTFSYLTGSRTSAYLDGGSKTQSASVQLSDLLTMAAVSYVGSYSGSTYFYNGPIQRLVIHPSSLSDPDVSNVANSIKDGP